MRMLRSRALLVATHVVLLALFCAAFFTLLSGCHHFRGVNYSGMMADEYARCEANVAAIRARENSTIEIDERDLSLEEERCHAAQARICAESARAAEQPEGCVRHDHETDEP